MTQAGSHISRRFLLIAGAIAPLGGCSLPYGLDMDTVGKSLKAGVGLMDAPRIPIAQAAAVPYSSIGYVLGKGEQRLLVLASSTGDQLLWTSAEHKALITRGGRIVNTAGFTWNLNGCDFPSGDSLIQGSLVHDTAAVQTIRYLDFQDLQLFKVAVQGHFQGNGSETIDILGAKLNTLVFVERCRSEELSWSFENRFWLDADSGFVWRSEQMVHPKLDPIRIEVFRPPAA